MENVLLHAVKDTVFIGGEPEKDAFHIALTGTADYIPHMGVVALTVREHNKDRSSAWSNSLICAL